MSEKYVICSDGAELQTDMEPNCKLIAFASSDKLLFRKSHAFPVSHPKDGKLHAYPPVNRM